MTTTTTTTTTEISSNSNSSCRLLDCLNSLPFQDQRVFRSLPGHIELLRLSACCRSLRSGIRDDTALWQQLYHRDFLSGAYYTKEMDFVLWCVRTDVNNPCTSDKRADLLEKVDWYNTYRRRVSTENNWRYGRCNTTHIDMKSDNDEIDYSTDDNDNCIFIMQQNRSDRATKLRRHYTLEYLPHSNLRPSNNTVYNSTFSTSPNFLSLRVGNATQYNYVTGDHYIATSSYVIVRKKSYNVKIFSRKRGSVLTTFNVPAPYEVKAIAGKWVLLVDKSQGLYRHSPIYDIMVFDIDNNTMCPGSIDDTWSVACFYKTTKDTAIVYAARLAVDDVTEYVEWVLYQFSSNNPVIRLRSGSFELPEGMLGVKIRLAQTSYGSHMLLRLLDYLTCELCIIHSVASSGQSQAPRNCYDISDQHMPTPLLRAGCEYLIFDSNPAKVWTDLSYNDDQVLRIPDTANIQNIIGDLYMFTTHHNRIKRRLLIDISTKKVIRRLKAPARDEQVDDYAMVGTAYNSNKKHTLVIQEYGEL